MYPSPNSRNIDAALDVWAQAEQKKLGVVTDDFGRFEVLYASVKNLAPDIAKQLTRSAVLQLAGQIQRDLQLWSATSGAESVESLLARIPSLGRFTASGQLGNLRNEWQLLTQHRTNLLAQTAKERLQIFEEFRSLLPALPYRTEANGSVVYHKDFSAPEYQQKLLEELMSANEYKTNKDGFYACFVSDLPRTFWNIEIGGETKKFGLNNSEEKLAALKAVFGEDQKALSTATKILCQFAPSVVARTSEQYFPNQHGVLLSNHKTNDEPTFFTIRRSGENIEIEVDVYSKVGSVEIPPTPGNMKGKSWRVNGRHDRDGITGPGNYSKHNYLSFSMDIAAANAGTLRPAAGTSIKASTEIQLRPELPRRSS